MTDPFEWQIDVSVANGDKIDFGKCVAAGVGRAIVRIVNGNDGTDALAAHNVMAAKAAGLKVEGYCAAFPLPSDGEHGGRDPMSQAHLFCDAARLRGVDDGILWLDFEWPAIENLRPTWGQSPAGVLDWMCECIEWVRSAGITPGVYVSPYYATSIGCGARPDLATVPLWIANYEVSAPVIPAPWSDYVAWQYSDKGHVDGVPGIVDLSWRRVGT